MTAALDADHQPTHTRNRDSGEALDAGLDGRPHLRGATSFASIPRRPVAIPVACPTTGRPVRTRWTRAAARAIVAAVPEGTCLRRVRRRGRGRDHGIGGPPRPVGSPFPRWTGAEGFAPRLYPSGTSETAPKNGRETPARTVFLETSLCGRQDPHGMIVKRGSRYVVLSENGKRSFGEYRTRAAAVARLGQVEYFKSRDEAEEDADGTEDAASESVPTPSDASPERAVVVDGLWCGSFATQARTDAEAGNGAVLARYDAPMRVRVYDSRDSAEAARQDAHGAATAHVDAETGFLHARIPISRTGVQTYHDANGREWVEYRDPSEVFHPDAVESFSRVVVTNDHPPAFVTLDNVRDVMIGHTGSKQEPGGKHLWSDITITDADAIRDMRDGKLQVSPGYHARVIADAGRSPNGEPYHARQTDIRANHIALVWTGRSGPDVAFPTIDRTDEDMPKQEHLDIDTGSETEAQRADATDLSPLKARIDTLEADLQAKDGELAALKDAHASDLERVRADVARRIDLAARAAKVLDTVDHTRTDAELMRDVIVKVRPALADKVDARADDRGYLEAMFDMALEAHAENAKQGTKLDAVLGNAVKRNRKVDLNDLAERFARREPITTEIN